MTYFENLIIGAIEEVEDARDEDGNATTWSVYCGYSCGASEEKTPHYIYIVSYGENGYKVENLEGFNIAPNAKTYKALRTACKVAQGIAERRAESGCFYD